MIPVSPASKPQEFDRLVRQPGRRFLAKRPRPTSKEFRTHNYWTQILPQLHESYSGICAYSSHWIPYDTGSDTVEHFKSKKSFPTKAYDWTNYRLVCGTLNGRKGEYRDVIDPFRLKPGNFVLDFPSLLIKANVNAQQLKSLLISTISRLGLNDEGTCLKSRLKWTLDYCHDEITFDHLAKHAPFIGYELQRQSLTHRIKSIMLAN